MRKYAVIKNNIVVEVLNLEDDSLSLKSINSDSIIDIEDVIPEPEIGWLLEGNKLRRVSVFVDQDELDKVQQKAQRKFGLKILPDAIDDIGARNLKLQREGTPADVATLASQMASIKVLLEGGALKTVRGICSSIKGMHPNHADILDSVIAKISNFLNENGWN